MSWEQDITEQLQQVSDIAVRFDVHQELTNNEKQTARTNIGINSTAIQVSDDDYGITLNY